METSLVQHVTGVSCECLRLQQCFEDFKSDDGKINDLRLISQATQRGTETESEKLDRIDRGLSDLRTQQNSMQEKTVEACCQSVANLRLDLDERFRGINQYLSLLPEKVDKLKQSATLVGSMLKLREEKLRQRGSVGDSTMSNAERQQFSAQDRVLAVQDIKLAEYGLRLDIMDCKGIDGVLLWKIMEVQRRRRDAISGKTPSIYSQPFYTSPCGYKMCGRLYLDGDGVGKHTHLSLFFVIMRGEYDALLSWPFAQKVALILIDQDGHHHISDTFRPDPRSSSFQRPRSEMNVASGCPLFVPLTRLDSEKYVKDDSMFIKIVVDTVGASAPDAR